MADATAEREDLVRSLIIWAIALAAGIVVAFVVGGLLGLGAAPGLIFGAATFLVLPYLVPAHRKTGAAAVPAAHGHSAAAAHVPVTAPHPAAPPPPHAEPAPLAEAPGEVRGEATEPGPGATISERVREAARAAGEAARAAVGEVTAGERPAALEAARGGAPDDLKRIKGVGPKLEALLHSLGIFHFDQIAGWGPAEVAWMDSNLEGFPGRVTRDGWVEQARLLAAGGETEFSQRVDRGDVY